MIYTYKFNSRIYLVRLKYLWNTEEDTDMQLFQAEQNADSVILLEIQDSLETSENNKENTCFWWNAYDTVEI
jgi:hypothetical protein